MNTNTKQIATENETSNLTPLADISPEGIERRARERDASGFWDEPEE
jgi:hypothetical protein